LVAQDSACRRNCAVLDFVVTSGILAEAEIEKVMRATKLWWIFALLAFPVLAAGQGAQTPESFHAEILRTYDFQPHALDQAQIAKKSDLLDQFWANAKAQRGIYVPGLRRELADFSNPPFFLFDGSHLLMNLSDEPADRIIILAAIAHCDLRDVQQKDYFLLVHRMAALGEDTTAAAFHILEDPDFQVIIPEHALTLSQNYCLIYMLLPTNQDFWIRPAIMRLHDAKDMAAQKSLLLLLWYAQTSEADKAIGEFLAVSDKQSDSRKYASELIHRKEGIDDADPAAVSAATEDSLRTQRRERMKAVSDEALDDLDVYTAKIIVKRNAGSKVTPKS